MERIQLVHNLDISTGDEVDGDDIETKQYVPHIQTSEDCKVETSFYYALFFKPTMSYLFA